MGNKNVRLQFSGVYILTNNLSLLILVIYTPALDEVTSDESSGYLMRDFKGNLINALEKIEDQILENSSTNENLLISSAASFALLFLYLLSLGFIINSVSNAKQDIKKLKISKQEMSSSNMNFLNLNRGPPHVPEIPKIKDAKTNTNPESAIVNF